MGQVLHLLHNMPVALAALVLVTGSGPGLGKSTLARSLAEHHRANGRSVALFAEEDIYTDPAFRCVVAEFKASGRVDLSTLLEASSSYVNDIDDGGSAQVVVFDALFAYVPSLLAWGYTDHEIAEFMQCTAQIFGGHPVVELHLVGDLVGGLRRAGAREGTGWLDRHVLKVSSYKAAPHVSALGMAAAYLDELESRAAELLISAPWKVEFLDVDTGFSSVTANALTILEALFDS